MSNMWELMWHYMKSENPSRFFTYPTEEVKTAFKEVYALDVPDKHDGTAFNHTMRVMDRGDSPLQRWGLLCHDLGKGVTPKESHPCHYDHDKLGVAVVKGMCQRIQAPNEMTEIAVMACSSHMKLKRVLEMRKGTLLDFVIELGKHWDLMVGISYVDSVCREGAKIKDELEAFKKIRKRVESTVHAISVYPETSEQSRQQRIKLMI